MRYYLDTELQGHCLIFDGPLDLVRSGLAGMKKHTDLNANFTKSPNINFPGRRGSGWDIFEKFLGSPWPEAIKRVQFVQAAVKKETMPTPKSFRRKPRFNEVDGEIDVDKAMHGDPDYYRRVQRERT